MTLHDPKCIKTRILAFLPKIIEEIYSAYDMNTQTLRTLKDRQFYYYMPPFGGIKPVCHDRHKTVPEFIVVHSNSMRSDVDDNHRGTFTDVKFACTLCQSRTF